MTTHDVWAARDGVLAYLRAKYGAGRDLTWHPLFTAMRELFVEVLDRA